MMLKTTTFKYFEKIVIKGILPASLSLSFAPPSQVVVVHKHIDNIGGEVIVEIWTGPQRHSMP